MKKLIVSMLMVLGVSQVQAHTFWAYNKSSEDIVLNPRWYNRDQIYDVIKPGESKFYDSGFNYLYKLCWKKKDRYHALDIQAATMTIESWINFYDDKIEYKFGYATEGTRAYGPGSDSCQ